jgi:TonB family protein
MQLREVVKSNRLLIFVLLSLFIHLTWYYSILNVGFRKRFVAPIQSFFGSARNKRSLNLTAKLRAPHSNFGWVLFDEPPQAKKQLAQAAPIGIPTTMDGDVGVAQQRHATEEEPGKEPEKKPEPIPEITPETSPEQKSQQETITEVQQKQEQPQEAPQAETPQTTEVSPSKPTTSLETEQAQQPTSIADRITHIKELQERLESFQSGHMPYRKTPQATSVTPPKQIADRFIGGPDGIRIRGAQSEQPQPKRNIIALTKGFVEKLIGEEGTDLVDRDGDPTKLSLEEQRQLAYEAKINWCLQAAWKQNFCKHAPITPLDGNVVVEFTLDEHGKITQSTLLQSSGKPHLDTMIMKLITLASPYPPLPKLFGTKTHTTGRIIQVYTNRFNF